jgi:RNA polymerase sigma-70 factor (ECF subfamily)
MAQPELDPNTLERARRGDRAARQALVLRYQNLVFASAARVLGRDAPEVPDVAQDAMIKVLHGVARFEPERGARLSTWIATVTLRTAIDAARRRRNIVPLEALDDVPAADLQGLDDVIDDAIARAKLQRAVAALSPEQRAAVSLRVEHDLSYDEIAEALRVEVGTVKSRLARATAALAAALSPRARRGTEAERHG